MMRPITVQKPGAGRPAALCLAALLATCSAAAADEKTRAPEAFDIELAVERELIHDDAVSYDPLDDEVEEGVVTLSGTVDNLLVDDAHHPLKLSPHIDTWSLTGLDWYDYQPAKSFESDAAIHLAVEEQLAWSPFVDADDVEVEVADGVVTLRGEVADRHQRQAAARNALEGGAVWVHNHLQIAGR